MSPYASNRPSHVALWDFMAITKALADENRVRMLLALRGGELCLCQIAELVSLAPSTASKHMSILRLARLVQGRKQGRWMYYRWGVHNAAPGVRRMLRCLEESLANDPQVRDDAQRLRAILKIDPHELCASGFPPKTARRKPRRPAKAQRQ
jgi:DNA-binding transcriptional ArsR family regulator